MPVVTLSRANSIMRDTYVWEYAPNTEPMVQMILGLVLV